MHGFEHQDLIRRRGACGDFIEHTTDVQVRDVLDVDHTVTGFDRVCQAAVLLDHCQFSGIRGTNAMDITAIADGAECREEGMQPIGIPIAMIEADDRIECRHRRLRLGRCSAATPANNRITRLKLRVQSEFGCRFDVRLKRVVPIPLVDHRYQPAVDKHAAWLDMDRLVGHIGHGGDDESVASHQAFPIGRMRIT